ncbi:MAG: hypothetical protein AB7P69_18645, partial [Candidatus Binatia bacterium]
RVPGVETVRRVGTDGKNTSLTLVLEYQGEDIRKRVSAIIMKNGWGLLEIRSLEPTLEDLYLQLIRETELSH